MTGPLLMASFPGQPAQERLNQSQF